MQYVDNSHQEHPHSGAKSIKYRRHYPQTHPELSEGLDRDVRRYDLLTLVKRVGKGGGFSPRMIQLLDYYMAFTRDCDWEEGAQPIVFQSVTNTAMDLGISERQVQRMELRLFELGALIWCDSGNHRRYGKRDPETGMLVYGFGVDLSPLASLQDTLENILAERAAYIEEWRSIKRQISWYRSQLRGMIAAVENEQGREDNYFSMYGRYSEIAKPVRSTAAIAELASLLEAHRDLYADLEKEFSLCAPCELLSETSSMNDQNVVHIENTNQPPLFEKNSSPADRAQQEVDNTYTEPQAEPQTQKAGPQKPAGDQTQPPKDETEVILSTGLQHITLKHALDAASDEFRAYIPTASRPMRWSDLVEAAWQRRQALSISQSLWGDACETLGRNGAAVAVLIVDRAASREEFPVQLPASYFRAMITRAHKGQLNLQASVFAWMKRSFERHAEHCVS